jgi:hypothetical protein
MMWGSLLTAGMLVFVDVMKELPATLIIRPFNFDTLAIRVYNLASDERLAEASGSALALVAVGIIPVILLSSRIAKSRQSQSPDRRERHYPLNHQGDRYQHQLRSNHPRDPNPLKCQYLDCPQ